MVDSVGASRQAVEGHWSPNGRAYSVHAVDAAHDRGAPADAVGRRRHRKPSAFGLS